MKKLPKNAPKKDIIKALNVLLEGHRLDEATSIDNTYLNKNLKHTLTYRKLKEPNL